ncbi:MAG: YbaB/EbfC family nucleoid-associated protein [Clostridiales Family XIII bacterium]|jgi:DNA-binding YbaB/EbfC family protein|nr:YbaB/EbfC family nucleoid-associated protein [Clostridiales Family XIII bacterium]
MGKGMKAGKKKSPGSGGGSGRKAMQQMQQAQQSQQLQQFAAVQAQMDKVQEEIELKEVETTAGGGAVAVKVNGKKEVISVKIDPDVMDKDDPEMLQDLIIVAVNEAIRQIEEISQSEMEKVTGGLNLPF